MGHQIFVCPCLGMQSVMYPGAMALRDRAAFLESLIFLRARRVQRSLEVGRGYN